MAEEVRIESKMPLLGLILSIIGGTAAFYALTTRVAVIEARAEVTVARTEKHEDAIAAWNQTASGLEKVLIRLDGRLGRIEDRLTALERKVTP